MKARFIINPLAGGGKRAERIGEAVRSVLGGSEGVYEIKVATGKADAGNYAADAVKRGYEAVFACGGDGTINDVAKELAGTETALGIVPAGSGNALANSLNIPRDIEEAVALLKAWKVLRMDVGVACGRPFFSTAGFAFEAFLSRKYNEGRLSGKLRGVAPYYPLALWEYFRYRSVPFEVRVDGTKAFLTPLIVTVANTAEFGSGAVIAPGARVDDGVLDVCLVERTNILGAFALAKKILSGRVEKSRRYRRLKGKDVFITGPGRFDCHVDGEPFEHRGNITIGIQPGGLKVLIP